MGGTLREAGPPSPVSAWYLAAHVGRLADLRKQQDASQTQPRPVSVLLQPDQAAPDHQVAEIAQLCISGYCLWIGAGLGIQLGNATSISIPSWTSLVHHIEKAYRIPNNHSDINFPERLEIVRRTIGHRLFQRELRLRCVIPTARALLALARRWMTEDKPPLLLNQLSLLSSLSSSIVNFNIESISSRALGAPGHLRIKSFHPPTEGSSGFRSYCSFAQNPSSGEAMLNIFHPHGAVDISGRTVLTSRDYDSLTGTLGLQIATHQAFMDNVVILGMSLDDSYLREQISRFREQMRNVYWIRGKFDSHEHSGWARANDIQEIHIPDYNDHWSIFSSLASRGVTYPGGLILLAWHEKRRLARTARGLSAQLPHVYNAAYDISTKLGEIDTLKIDDDDFTQKGHRLVFAADSGEDLHQPRVLGRAERAELTRIESYLKRYAKNIEDNLSS